MWPFSKASAEPAPVKACADCRWSQVLAGNLYGGEQHQCINPELASQSLVTGELIGRSCSYLRYGPPPIPMGWPVKPECGERGKYFEPRPLSDRMNVGE